MVRGGTAGKVGHIYMYRGPLCLSESFVVPLGSIVMWYMYTKDTDRPISYLELRIMAYSCPCSVRPNNTNIAVKDVCALYLCRLGTSALAM